MRHLKNFITETRKKNPKARIEDIESALTLSKPGWSLDGNCVKRSDKVIFGLHNYESGYENKKSVIWMEQGNSRKVPAEEIGRAILNLPDSDWVLVKGSYNPDSDSWSLYDWSK